MPTLRFAVPEDAALITGQRHRMFEDNEFGSDSTLAAADGAFEPWVRERLQDGRYVGLFLEEQGRVVAGAGIFFADFPPHWMHVQAQRAYVLNVYTAPEGRGRGYARRLMEAVVEECSRRGVSTVVLHASPQGRALYESMGFELTSEMMLRLG